MAVGCPHHVTQRGNQRRDVFLNDQLRQVYLDLLAEHSKINHLRIQAYCLMTNHLHVVAVPEQEHSLATTFRNTHGRFAQFWNTMTGRVGHMWQNRYYSCPLEAEESWRAIRYVELNAVRAGIAGEGTEYRWSSARAHTGMLTLPWLDQADWPWSTGEWGAVLAEASEQDCVAIRKATYSGRPWGSREFVLQLERQLGRRLAPAKGGRPRKASSVSLEQAALW